MRNTVRPCVPLDGKKVLLVGQCFAIQRHILLLRHVFIYVSGRNLCVTRQLLFYPSPFTFWLGMLINTRVSRGEGLLHPFTHPSPPFTFGGKRLRVYTIVVFSFVRTFAP